MSLSRSLCVCIDQLVRYKYEKRGLVYSAGKQLVFNEGGLGSILLSFSLGVLTARSKHILFLSLVEDFIIYMCLIK